MHIVPIPNRITYYDGNVGQNAVITKEIITDASLGEEGYIIRTSLNSITLSAQTEAGLFYAEKTLEQLSLYSSIPCMEITDSPAFSYRGFMLDSARHMQTLDEIKKLVDAAALLKLNTMHWHLSDDQGYRIESKKFPLLNEKGSWRESDDFGSMHTGVRYGGYYTHEEIREVVSYCKERFIDVVPEIDLPGHTTAIISSYPHLSCRKEQIPVQTKQGIFEDVLCVSSEETLEFVYALLDEVMPLFESERFHIGGDEVKFNRWKECPKCKEKLKTLGKDNYAALQADFTEKLISYLRSKGKKVTVWNESLAGGNIDRDTTVQMWMDAKKHSVRHANRAGKVIVSDFYHYYCDYPYYMTPLEKTYNFDPILKGIAPVMSKHVIGVEVPIWTEYICDFDKLCYMFFPRFAAVAEVGWSKKEKLNCRSFERRFKAITPLLEKRGIKPAPPSHWNPTTAERLTGTIGFFKDKISISALTNSFNSQKN